MFDGVVDRSEHDRDLACGRLEGGGLLPADTDDDGRGNRHQLLGQAAEPVRLAHRVARLEQDVLAIDVAELFERRAKRSESLRFDARAGTHQDADAWNSRRLLR